MTNEEHRKIVDAVINAHKDNEMGGKYAKAFNHGVQSAFNRVCKALEDIEKQPCEERPKGKWTYIGNSEVNGLKICECSVCEKRTYGSLKYCPNCGAKMEEGE